MKKVLFVGESWSATLMEVKGFNSFYHLNMKQTWLGRQSDRKSRL